MNENEIIEENVEQNNGEVSTNSEGDSVAENGQESQESYENNEEIESIMFVSGNDNDNESAQTMPVISEVELENIAKEIEILSEKMDELIKIKQEENETETIWEKPLEEYTVEESLELMLVISILVATIFCMVGGIIKCKL